MQSLISSGLTVKTECFKHYLKAERYFLKAFWLIAIIYIQLSDSGLSPQIFIKLINNYKRSSDIEGIVSEILSPGFTQGKNRDHQWIKAKMSKQG